MIKPTKWLHFYELERRLRPPKGFTLVEVIAATVIISFVIISTVQAALQSLRLFNQASAREGIEQSINNDLGWLRAYSKSWNCQVGPYEGCIVKSKGIASAINYLPEIYSEDPSSAYDQFKQWCLNREKIKTGATTPAKRLLLDASLITSGSYKAPNTIPTTELQKVQISLANAPVSSRTYKVYRTLKTMPTTTEEESFLTGNSILVHYFTDPSDSPYVRINRTEQLFIEATAWCP